MLDRNREKATVQGFPVMWPKIVEPYGKEVYFLGGTYHFEQAYARCFKLESPTSQSPQLLVEISPMRTPRYAFGTCVKNQYIYCTGGVTHHDQHLQECERYDIICDTWEELPKLP